METKGGSIKSTSINGVKLYSISGQRNPAAWLAPKKLKALRKDKGSLSSTSLSKNFNLGELLHANASNDY